MLDSIRNKWRGGNFTQIIELFVGWEFFLILSEFSCYFDENLKLNRNELDDDDGQEDSKTEGVKDRFPFIYLRFSY